MHGFSVADPLHNAHQRHPDALALRVLLRPQRRNLPAPTATSINWAPRTPVAPLETSAAYARARTQPLLLSSRATLHAQPSDLFHAASSWLRLRLRVRRCLLSPPREPQSSLSQLS